MIIFFFRHEQIVLQHDFIIKNKLFCFLKINLYTVEFT